MYLTISCNTSLEWIAPGTHETTHAAPSILSPSKMRSSTSVVLPDCGGPCTKIDWGQQEAGHEASRRERAAEAEADGVDAAEEWAEHIMRLRWLIPSPFVASPASVLLRSLLPPPFAFPLSC